MSSNNEESRGRRGCGRNCLSKCCLLQGAELPLYAFATTDGNSSPSSLKDGPWLPNFVDLLMEQWDDRQLRGLFHHNITASERKVLPGEYGFIVQLIEGRDLKKRPTEFQVDRVLQPFDGNKFNFTKIGQEEVLFRFEVSESNETHYFPNALISASDSPNIIAINVSPIAYCHVLLIPKVLDCLPQRTDPESFLLALYMAKEARNPNFRVGYNSLGAFATINHLHFQAFYFEMPFPVEKALTERIATLKNGVNILKLLGYPVKGLVFEGGSRLQDLSDAVSRACVFLQDNNRPHNVLISDSGERIFLFLQCYAEKRARGEVSQDIIDTQVNPAVWEVSGYMVLKQMKDYEEASEERINRLFHMVSLSEGLFQEVQGHILDAIVSKDDENNMGREKEGGDDASNG